MNPSSPATPLVLIRPAEGHDVDTVFRFLLFWPIVLLFPAVLSAQSADPSCGFERVHQTRLATDSHYRFLVGQALDRTVAKGVAANDELYTIPVVFVVYHVGEAVGTGSNVADATLIEQVALLNRYYAAEAPFSDGVNSRIRFVLAQRSPTCQSGSGIVRVDARTATGYQTNGVTNYTDAFRLLPLLPEYGSSQADRFVFIRVVKNLTFAAGFATFGGGIFVDARLINTAQTGNTLLAHEMGHVLCLYHTFQGSANNGTFVCPANVNPALYGDEVTDTAPHKQFDPPGCSESALNSCTGQPFGALVHNLMTYGNCRDRFPPGQVARMRANLTGPLASLAQSLYRFPPAPAETLVPPACRVTYGVAPDNQNVGISRITFNSIDHASGSFPGLDGFYNDYSCSEKTTVRAGASYAFQATATNPVTVYVDYNNDGTFDESSERVLDGVNRGSVLIPLTAVRGAYLRMRVRTDPGAGRITACYLPGDAFYGSGEIEDYGLQVQAEGVAVHTMKSGEWSNPAVWSGGQVPGSADAVTISAGHAITVNTAVNSQTILYQPGGRILFLLRVN